MRRALVQVCIVLMCAASSVSVASAASSPYPSVLKMQSGLAFSTTAHQPPAWGTVLTAAQARWVTIKSAGTSYRWGVWKPDGGPPTFPVRSLNGGITWRVAGPQLASDWAGGSLYYVDKVFPGGPSVVVMVSNSVIDVTTDGGRQWYQYLNAADNWSITLRSNVLGISLRISAASYSSNTPKGSYAIYELNFLHQWVRLSQSLT